MSAQLDLVGRLARERQDLAAQALGQAQAQLADSQAQLRQILNYQADYQAKARGEQGGALAASQLVEARRFLDEINTIVATQHRAVQEAEAVVARQQADWAEAARYTQAIEKLSLERRAALSQAAEKREQQQLDDLHGQKQFRVR